MTKLSPLTIVKQPKQILHGKYYQQTIRNRKKTRFQGKSAGDSKIIAKFAKLMKFVGLRKLTTDTMGETLRSPCNAKR